MSAWKIYSFLQSLVSKSFLLFQTIILIPLSGIITFSCQLHCNQKIYYDQVITEKPCYKKRYSPMWHYCQCATMANMPYHKMACLCNGDTMQYWHDLPCLLHFIWAIYTKYEWSVISWFSFKLWKTIKWHFTS